MSESATQKTQGLAVRRYFTRPGVHPFDEVEWERRDARIGADDKPVFEQRDVEFPKEWSQHATNIVSQKYFRGQLGSPDRERSVKQMIGRVAGTIASWGREGGYFESAEDAEIFEHELTHVLLHQMAAFNSPVWFNVGFEERPQASACFILSVEDTMESILDWNTQEGLIFRGGSGSGINLSKIRSSKESLSKGGLASGPVSFMRGADSWAGTIKSGGKCFREGTLVAVPDGLVPVESLSIGDTVLTHKGPRPILDFMPNGRKQCYLVKTCEGYEVEVTEGHKFAYWDAAEGFFKVKPIERFAPGEHLYVLPAACPGGTEISLAPPEGVDKKNATTTVEMDFPSELDEELSYVLGLIYGDGELHTEYPYRVRVSFAKNPAGRASAARFREYCTRLFGDPPLLLQDEPGYQVLGFTRQRLVEFLVANGFAKGKGDALGFPTSLYQAKPEIRAAFLAGFIDADGTYQRRGGWSVSSIDRSFLVAVQRLLLTLGIPSKLKHNRKRKGNWRDLYRLHITSYTFIERLVGWIASHSAKAAHDYEPSLGADKGWGFRPSLYHALTSRLSQRGGFRLVERTVGMNETTGHEALTKLSSHPDVAIASYAEELSSCVQVALESVQPTKVAETYDIEVDDVHLLSANGLYASNTRRAAKMIVLDVDHPDIRDFIWCKAREEEKARALADAGFDMSIDGEGFTSIQYQNANNSVRVTDEFMQAAIEGKEWKLTARKSGKAIEAINATRLLHEMADAAWRCADPGVQYDTTINNWHTCPNSGRINASNPCSEFMHVDDSACNLASLNLMRFADRDVGFDIEAFQHAVDTVFTAQEILVDFSSYPTEKIDQNAKAFRQLGLGYSNLGALLMAEGLPYDSDEGRRLASAVTALMTGRAYRRSAEMAAAMGPFEKYQENAEPMKRVIRMHREAARKVSESSPGTSSAASSDFSRIIDAALDAWDDAVVLGERDGYRNAQASVLAPTGTISFLLDCDTTGIEPEFSLVKVKELVGGGQMTIVNRTVPAALKQLGYSKSEIEQIEAYINEHGTIVGAPALKEKHLPVFDVAIGERAIRPMGHIGMMSAVQPFISGAISKTVNMSAETTVDEIEDAFIQGWKLGLKALAIYRDESKTAQALRTQAREENGEEPIDPGSSADQRQLPPSEEEIASASGGQAHPASEPGSEPHPASAPGEERRPARRRLPRERQSITHKFTIGQGHEGYITAGKYEDGSLGEIFLTDIGKDGSTLRGMMNAFATAISVGLQYGVPLETFVRKFSYMRFDPEGVTQNPEIPFAKSLPDYIMRWLASRFLDVGVQEELGILTPEVRERKAQEEAVYISKLSPINGGKKNGGGTKSQEGSGGGGGTQGNAAGVTDTRPDDGASTRKTVEAGMRKADGTDTQQAGGETTPPANGAITPEASGSKSKPKGRGNGYATDYDQVAEATEPQPAAAALTDRPPVIPARLIGGDVGPACSTCGGMMIRTGSCYTCQSCGSNTGCG